jgi:hypothetical protein
LDQQVFQILVSEFGYNLVFILDFCSDDSINLLVTQPLVLVLGAHVLLSLVFQLQHAVVDARPDALPGNLARVNKDAAILLIPARLGDESVQQFSLMLGELVLMNFLQY